MQVEPGHRKAYMLGGNAKFTVVSPKGTSFTYLIRGAKKGEGPHFVSVLTGPDNTADFTFLGTIFDAKRYFPGKKSPIPATAPSATAFKWIWDHVEDPRIEVLSSGACSRCGRELTDEESIRTGLGPICRTRV
jgi:hypothetical protein